MSGGTLRLRSPCLFEIYLNRIIDYRMAVDLVAKEDKDIGFPSQARQAMWQSRHELKEAFRDAVKDVLL